MKQMFFLILKGLAMGVANVIPGVSGGTIAFVTGIYDQLISSLKSFDVHAVKLLLAFKIKEFIEYTNLKFLFFLFLGVGVGVFTFGKLLKILFAEYPIPVWSLFFGLIVASVYLVGRTIKKWNFSVIISLLIGCACALFLATLKPAPENGAMYYLFVCGIVAMISMLLPGLSGSFVLILLGNYQLIMLDAVSAFNFKILLPVGFGAVFGFVILSRAISFCLSKFEFQTISMLTGFVLGSLLIIWPWKNSVFLTDLNGEFILKKGQQIVSGYEWYIPNLSTETYVSIALIIFGFVVAIGVDIIGSKFSKES